MNLVAQSASVLCLFSILKNEKNLCFKFVRPKHQIWSSTQHTAKSIEKHLERNINEINLWTSPRFANGCIFLSSSEYQHSKPVLIPASPFLSIVIIFLWRTYSFCFCWFVLLFYYKATVNVFLHVYLHVLMFLLDKFLGIKLLYQRD